MFELSSQDFGRIEPLIQDIDHDAPIIYAVLEHSSPGRIWVDNVVAPTAAFIYPYGAFYYIVGEPNKNGFLPAIWDLLQNSILPDIQNPAGREVVLFALSGNWQKPLELFMKTQRGITIIRKTFRFNAERFIPQPEWRVKILEDMTLRAIDAEILAHDSLPIVNLDTWNSPQIFFSKGAGACLLHQGKVVSACATVFVGRGVAELDVHTLEAYHGQGLARFTAAACIEMCLAKGLQPRWACWPEREASIALAKRLGFEEYQNVPAYYWRAEL